MWSAGISGTRKKTVMAETIARPEPIQKGPLACAGPAGKASMIWGKAYVPANAPILPIAAAAP